MRSTSLKIKILMTACLVTSTFNVFANALNFKVAVVENSGFNNEIANKNYSSVINQLTKKYIAKMSLEEQMQLCVAYIKSNSMSKSEQVCSAAVKNIAFKGRLNTKERYLKSINYSNRAISRYLNNDIAGAISDLTFAVSFDNNDVVNTNLQLIKADESFVEDKMLMSSAE